MNPDPLPRFQKPPVPRYIAWLATVMLTLSILAVVSDLRRVRTGELLIQSDVNAIKLEIRQDERVVVSVTDRRSFTLKPGDYEVRIVGGPGSLRAIPSPVVVKRGVRSVVRVEKAE